MEEKQECAYVLSHPDLPEDVVLVPLSPGDFSLKFRDGQPMEARPRNRTYRAGFYFRDGDRRAK